LKLWIPYFQILFVATRVTDVISDLKLRLRNKSFKKYTVFLKGCNKNTRAGGGAMTCFFSLFLLDVDFDIEHDSSCFGFYSFGICEHLS